MRCVGEADAPVGEGFAIVDDAPAASNLTQSVSTPLGQSCSLGLLAMPPRP
jgi:hypothetical protein